MAAHGVYAIVANRIPEVWLMEIEIKVPNGVCFFVIGIFVFNCRNKSE